jgi:E3 ubiquitin-protein ligase UBR1
MGGTRGRDGYAFQPVPSLALVQSAPLSSTMPSSSSISRSPDPPDHHRILEELLLHIPLQRQGNFTSSSHATLIRQLFATIWQRDWVRFFDVERGDHPSGRELSEWIYRDDLSIERGWSLRDSQKRAVERKRKLGITRPFKKGRICAKIMQRYERTYTCR